MEKNFCSLFADNTKGGCFQTLRLRAAAARVYLLKKALVSDFTKCIQLHKRKNSFVKREEQAHVIPSGVEKTRLHASQNEQQTYICWLASDFLRRGLFSQGFGRPKSSSKIRMHRKKLRRCFLITFAYLPPSHVACNQVCSTLTLHMLRP